MRASRPEPPPKPGKKTVLGLVQKDLKDRAEFGKAKYGSYLMTGNGRDALKDLYDEILDAAMYARQQIEDRETERQRNRRRTLAALLAGAALGALTASAGHQIGVRRKR